MDTPNVEKMVNMKAKFVSVCDIGTQSFTLFVITTPGGPDSFLLTTIAWPEDSLGSFNRLAGIINVDKGNRGYMEGLYAFNSLIQW